MQCTEGTPCDIVCAKPWAFQVITCGEWVDVYGDFYPGSTCKPGFSATLEEESASMARDSADGSESVCHEPEASLPSEG